MEDAWIDYDTTSTLSLLTAICTWISRGFPMAAMTSHVLQGSMRVAPAMEHRRTSREALPVVPLAFHVPAATCITAGGALVSTATAFMLRRLSGPQKPEQVVPKRLGWKNGLGKDPGMEILHSN